MRVGAGCSDRYMPKTPLSAHFFPKVLTTTPPAPSTRGPSAPSGRRARPPLSVYTLRFSSSPGSTLSGRCYPSRLCVASRRSRTLGARASLRRDLRPESPRPSPVVAIESAHLLVDVGEALSADLSRGAAPPGRLEGWTTLPAQLPAVCCPELARLLMFSRQRGPDDPNGDRGPVRARRCWPPTRTASKRPAGKEAELDRSTRPLMLRKKARGIDGEARRYRSGLRYAAHVGLAAPRSWRWEGGGCSALGGSAGECEAAACQDVSEEAKAIGHDAVDLEIEELVDRRLLVDRPHVHR
jgi:hypothetical protein